jgi:hypothetical protein
MIPNALLRLGVKAVKAAVAILRMTAKRLPRRVVKVVRTAMAAAAVIPDADAGEPGSPAP